MQKNSKTERSRFHFTKLEGSARLRKLLDYMRSHYGATTLQISEAMGGMQSVSTWISSLRHNGFTIDSYPDGVTENGSRVYKYFLREPV